MYIRYYTLRFRLRVGMKGLINEHVNAGTGVGEG